MAPLFLVIALILQSSFIYADTDVESIREEYPLSTEESDIPVEEVIDDEGIKDFRPSNNDWIDLLFLTNTPIFPGSSATVMTQATNNTNQTCEEQLQNIQKAADEIYLVLKDEMEHLLNFALILNNTEQNEENNGLRKKRSVETPMDSTQLIMKLLTHIKSNNEYQNIAIEKMMTAQEIADKFGVEFNPDPEILTDLAVAANNHAQDLTALLKDACEVKNATQEIEFVPFNNTSNVNETYYTYTLHPEEEITQENTVSTFEYVPEILASPQSVNHVGYQAEPHHHHESQIPSPPVHHHSPAVTPRPNFYDSFIYSDMYSPYVDPFSAILIPIEEPEPEPEMVGEEIEETITTKLFVERGDEPGSSTVNQVTTYTVAEKSHFRSPQIEKYPQQFQYCFFLM